MDSSHGPQPLTSARVYVVQDGARRHYAVPRVFCRAGILEKMAVMGYVAPGSWSERIVRAIRPLNPGRVDKLLARQAEELSGHLVHQSWWRNLSAAWGSRKAQSKESGYEIYRQALDRLVRSGGFGKANLLFGYVRNVPPALLDHARSCGLATLGDQMIAPAWIERRELSIQQERFPGWETDDEQRDHARTESIERQTWDRLDALTCGSAYVRDGLIESGVAADRVSMVPYPVDTDRWRPADRRGRVGPVTVGFVGRVGLRKGAPYFFEAARKLSGRAVRFVMVGPTSLRREVVAAHGGGVELVGAVARPEVARWLERFDLLYFPSTCEGASAAVNEAMASGLPVVVSPNSGSIARDGEDGYVVAYDDTEAACQRLATLIEDPERRAEMGRSARANAEQHGLTHYGSGLAAVVRQTLSINGSASDCPER